jgi:hypothetical protein
MNPIIKVNDNAASWPCKGPLNELEKEMFQLITSG